MRPQPMRHGCSTARAGVAGTTVKHNSGYAALSRWRFPIRPLASTGSNRPGALVQHLELIRAEGVGLNE